MEISSVSSQSYQSTSSDPMAKMKQTFQKLGTALSSGNLSEAKDSLAKLQENAPANSTTEDNPLSAKVEALSKALESGDLEGAKDAYADIKKTMSQRPPAQGSAGAKGGPPPGGAKQPPGATSSSSSEKEYDKKDINKDGTVSAEEELLYSLQHPEDTDTEDSSTATKDDLGSLVNTTA